MKCNKVRKRAVSENVINLDEKRQPPTRKRKQSVALIPRNIAQENYIVALENYDNKIIIATGPAGTGKTMLGALMAVKMLIAGEVDRIIVTRPAVSADEELGFLPGDLNEKMAPWIRPIFDVFEEYFSPIEIRKMVEDGVIEIAPIGFLRGRTFKNSVVVADECQNLKSSTMLMLLTRIGENSRMFLTGDVRQTDIKGVNGLSDLLEKLKFKNVQGIEIVEFNATHVEREEVVKEVLNLYGQE